MRFILLYIFLARVTSLNYPYNPNIHNLGNHGLGGRIHAFMAPGITRLIDRTIYNTDVRANIGRDFENDTVLDIGCGVGISTMGKEGSLGIDTSIHMIQKARALYPTKYFNVGNGESFLGQWDVVTIMFVFHEAPQDGRAQLIENAKKMAKKRVVIVDIAPDYKPSRSMLSGEPYILDYLANIEQDLYDFNHEVIIEGHVHKWTFHCRNA
jgi:2-polyprenyl-3-methyl-5-hydroxy-6-metoxy-1,4-benzoquinol methylase